MPDSVSARTRALWIVQGAVALLGVAIGLGVFAAPELLTKKIDAKLRAQAAKRGVDLKIGHIWLQPLSAVTLDNVTLSDPTSGDKIASIRRVAISYDVHGVRSPKVYLSEIAVTDPDVRATRDKDGRLNIGNLIRSFQRRGTQSGGGGGGGLHKYLSKHVPRVRVTGMKLRVDDAKGGPLKTPSGVDLRHLRFTDASFELEDTSPVQEAMALKWSARTQVKGIGGAIGVRGQIRLPAKTGDVHVTLPEGFALQAGGLRAAVRGLSLYSDGRVEVTDVSVAKEGAGQRLALAIDRLSANVAMTPVPEKEIPAVLRERLSNAAILALRHVRRVALHRPVVIGSRPSRDAGQAEESQAAANKGAGNKRRKRGIHKPSRGLLPRATARTDLEGKESGKKRHRASKRPKRGSRKTSKSTGTAKGGAGKKTAKALPGEKVREALRALLVGASDRMEEQLTRVQRALSAMPLDEIRVHHGSARFRGERATTGLAREVSDYNLVVKRDGGGIVAKLDFSVPGRKGTQRIEGRVDTKSGDMRLKVRLDQLPLAPYAAILPSNVYVHSNSALHDTQLQVVVNRKDRTIAVDGSAALSHLDVRAPRISRHLLADLNLRGQGHLTLDLAREMVRLSKGEASVGKLTALIDGSVSRYRTAPAFDLHVKVPTVDCQDVVDSLVPNVAPMLIGMSCHGSASLRLNLGLDTKDMRSLKLEYKPLLRKVEIDNLGKYIRFDVLQRPFEHHTRQKDGTLYTFVTGPGSERWTTMEALTEHMPKVVTTTEDGSFFWHKGFSLNQIRSAFITNLLRGRFVRGASTISQQVVKNLFFVEFEKTLARKLQEAVITWQMERTLEKAQILELYFNIIEFGPQIYGIRAAASHYFNRPPSDLTLLQSIWLGSIIPNPKAFYHQFTKGTVKASWQKYLCWIGGVMRKREKITDAERARLGSCHVVFGGGTDGSEKPEAEGLGHDAAVDANGEPMSGGNATGDDKPLPPPKARPPAPDAARRKPPRPSKRKQAPSVADDEQP